MAAAPASENTTSGGTLDFSHPDIAADLANPQMPRSAIGWLARPFDSSDRSVKEVADLLVQISKDDNENQNVRQQALRTLAHMR